MTERPTNTQPDKQHKAPMPIAKHAPVAPVTPETKEKTDVKETKADKKSVAPVKKKEEAIAVGQGLHISLKHSMYISSFIKRKSIDHALADLEEVRNLRKAVPFKGEIPHRSEPGMMSGRYPQSAAQSFIRVLKNLKGNAIASGLALDKTYISYACASWASRPLRRGGRKAKRVHLVIKAQEKKPETKTHG